MTRIAIALFLATLFLPSASVLAEEPASPACCVSRHCGPGALQLQRVNSRYSIPCQAPIMKNFSPSKSRSCLSIP